MRLLIKVLTFSLGSFISFKLCLWGYQMCCVNGIVLAMQGILRVSADLLKPRSILISVKHWGFPRAFPAHLHSSSMSVWPSTSSPSVGASKPSCWSPENMAQTIILLPLHGKVCTVIAGGQQQQAWCWGKCLHLCLQAITAELSILSVEGIIKEKNQKTQQKQS